MCKYCCANYEDFTSKAILCMVCLAETAMVAIAITYECHNFKTCIANM